MSTCRGDRILCLYVLRIVVFVWLSPYFRSSDKPPTRARIDTFALVSNNILRYTQSKSAFKNLQNASSRTLRTVYWNSSFRYKCERVDSSTTVRLTTTRVYRIIFCTCIELEHFDTGAEADYVAHVTFFARTKRVRKVTWGKIFFGTEGVKAILKICWMRQVALCVHWIKIHFALTVYWAWLENVVWLTRHIRSWWKNVQYFPSFVTFQSFTQLIYVYMHNMWILGKIGRREREVYE